MLSDQAHVCVRAGVVYIDCFDVHYRVRAAKRTGLAYTLLSLHTVRSSIGRAALRRFGQTERTDVFGLAGVATLQ